jgi:FkbM family methyltransferase
VLISLYGRLAGSLPHSVVSRLYGSPGVTGIIRRAMNAVLPAELCETEVVAGPLAGTRLLVYPRSELSFISGLWEFWVQDALVAHLEPGDVAWDVGAYIGYFTLLMRQRCGPGNVVALEPDPWNRARMERILEMNRIGGIEIIPEAVGASDGTVRLTRHEEHPAMTGAAESGNLSVPQTTLDSLAARLGPPHLIKMDVEGAEAEILRAAPHMVEEVRPVWMLELHGQAGQEAVRILAAAGYRVRWLNRLESRTHQEHILAEPLTFNQ